MLRHFKQKAKQLNAVQLNLAWFNSIHFNLFVIQSISMEPVFKIWIIPIYLPGQAKEERKSITLSIIANKYLCDIFLCLNKDEAKT